MDEIDGAWRHLEDVLGRLLPRALATLRPGATAAEVDDLLALFEDGAPTEFVRSLRHHNGGGADVSSREQRHDPEGARSTG